MRLEELLDDAHTSDLDACIMEESSDAKPVCVITIRVNKPTAK